MISSAPMKRLFHVAFNSLIVLSLVLLVATVVLWVRSYWYETEYSAQTIVNRPEVYLQRVRAGSAHGIIWWRREFWPRVGSERVTRNRTKWFDLRSLGEAPYEWLPTAYRKEKIWPATIEWCAWGGFALSIASAPPPDPPLNKVSGIFLHWTRMWHVQFAHWQLALLFSINPTMWALTKWARVRRVARGGCVDCGYDLRATPGRCPECARVPGRCRTVRV